MAIQEKLTKGLAGWLQFEMRCNHVGVFSEKYLTKPVADILIGNYGPYVLAEVNHDVLKNDRGRPRQIDFGVREQGTDNLRLAIETKWLWGGQSLHHASLIYDLIRLELLANEFGCECYAILAGRKKDLVRWFNHTRFSLLRKERRYSFLSLRKPSQILQIHDHKRFDYQPLLMKAVSEIRDRTLPESVSLRRMGPYPVDARQEEPVVISWRVVPRGGKFRTVFTPSRTRFFRLTGSVDTDQAQ